MTTLTVGACDLGEYSLAYSYSSMTVERPALLFWFCTYMAVCWV